MEFKTFLEKFTPKALCEVQSGIIECINEVCEKAKQPFEAYANKQKEVILSISDLKTAEHIDLKFYTKVGSRFAAFEITGLKSNNKVNILNYIPEHERVVTVSLDLSAVEELVYSDFDMPNKPTKIAEIKWEGYYHDIAISVINYESNIYNQKGFGNYFTHMKVDYNKNDEFRPSNKEEKELYKYELSHIKNLKKQLEEKRTKIYWNHDYRLNFEEELKEQADLYETLSQEKLEKQQLKEETLDNSLLLEPPKPKVDEIRVITKIANKKKLETKKQQVKKEQVEEIDDIVRPGADDDFYRHL